MSLAHPYIETIRTPEGVLSSLKLWTLRADGRWVYEHFGVGQIEEAQWKLLQAKRRAIIRRQRG